MIGDTKNDELDTVEFLSLNINLVLKPIFSDFRKKYTQLALLIMAGIYFGSIAILGVLGYVM